MENPGRTPDFEKLEAKISELENLADGLGSVPDENLVEVLGRAVELLNEVNTGVESGMNALGEESREVGELLGRIDFGAFDTALGELEEQERSDERGP